MAEKTASVRVNADPKGFIDAMKKTEKAGVSAATKIENALSSSAEKAAERFLKAAKAVAKIAEPKLTGLERIKKLAEEVSDAYKEAYKNAVKLNAIKTDKINRAATVKSESNADVRAAIGTAIAGAASGAVALAVKSTMDANVVADKANRLSIGARGAGQEYVDPKLLTAEFFAIAKDVKGITAEAAADGAAKFVQMTGDLKTARASLKDFAIVANATGSSVEAVAGTAAAISQQFGITDPEQIKDVLASLAYQGKSGAFELKDAASLFPGLAAAGASFGLDKGVQGVKTLGGLTQIAMTGAGSGEVAATNVNALLTALKANAVKIEAQGTKVYDKGKVRDLPTILSEMIAKTGGNDIKRKNALLGTDLTATGFKAIAPLVTQYQEMFSKSEAKGDTAKQKDAMEQLRLKIMESINAAGTFADVQQDSARASSASSASMTASYESLKAGMAQKMLPHFAKLAEGMGKATPAINAFVTTMVAGASAMGFIAKKTTGWGESIGEWMAGDDGKKVDAADAERQKELAARAELASMQMSPADIAKMQKSDPAKLQEMRERAASLSAEADMHGQKSREIYATTESGKTMGAAAAARASGAVAGPDRVGINGVVQVHIMNPKDVGGGGSNGGAPTPGWVPPR